MYFDELFWETKPYSLDCKRIVGTKLINVTQFETFAL